MSPGMRNPQGVGHEQATTSSVSGAAWSHRPAILAAPIPKADATEPISYNTGPESTSIQACCDPRGISVKPAIQPVSFQNPAS